MDQSLDWKMVKCIEWSTELPVVNKPRKSPIFLIHNVECYFRFYRDSYTYYYVYLETKTKGAKVKPFSVVMYSDFYSLGNFCRYEVNLSDSKRYLYTFDERKIKIESNVLLGYFVKFCFVFEKKDGPFLRQEKEIDDKCVQTGSYLNADVAVESVSEDFTKLLDSGPNHDAEIRCGEHSIKAHKIVLCSRSEVFSAMLQSDMLEGRTGVIEIQDMDISYAQDFIRYLYTGIIPELTFDKAKVLYEAGDKYAARSLMLRCSEYLQDNLSAEIYFQCFTLADAHSDQKLKDRVITYILEKKMYLQEEIWLPFCKSYPEAAVEVYRLSYKNVTETKDM